MFDLFANSILMDGVVIDTTDPQEMGRLKVWCPAVDGENPDFDTIPWVRYVSPLAGQAHDYPAGGTGTKAIGPVSYGFWAVPKIGAQVVVGCLYGDVNNRIYIGSFFRDHGNRSLPAGRNVGNTPVSDSIDTIEPQNSNLLAQFNGDVKSSIAQTRGAYERQAAQAATDKTTTEGYNSRVIPVDEEAGLLDPQLYCLTTPGRHSIIMQDHPTNARVRIKTAEGHQIILDDANERIYISTSRGRTWVELDVDGHMHIYAAESISMSAGKDFNLSAAGNINLNAGGDLNLGAAGSAKLSACSEVSISGKGVDISSAASFNILASANLLLTGSQVHLNGPKAKEAACADSPTLVPSHEPWQRPATSGKRGKNWKE